MPLLEVPWVLLRAPEPWAWAINVRNSPVLPSAAPLPEELRGCMALVVSTGEYDASAAAWMKKRMGVDAPGPAAKAAPRVAAIGRITHLGEQPAAPGARWWRGGEGAWLRGVLAPVLQVPPGNEPWRRLQEAEAQVAREAYLEEWAVLMDLALLTPVERNTLSAAERTRRVAAAFAQVGEETVAKLLEAFLAG